MRPSGTRHALCITIDLAHRSFVFVNLFADRIPTRFNVAIMLFMACLISYMLRVNMSVNILAMVQPIQSNTRPIADADNSTTGGVRPNRTADQTTSIVPNVGVPRPTKCAKMLSDNINISVFSFFFFRFLIRSRVSSSTVWPPVQLEFARAEHHLGGLLLRLPDLVVAGWHPRGTLRRTGDGRSLPGI